jgi:hypothetical protein
VVRQARSLERATCPHNDSIGPRRAGVKGASQGMTTQHGQPTRAAAKWARAMANTVEVNESRRMREPPIIDWDEAIANLHDILDDIYATPPPPFRRR